MKRLKFRGKKESFSVVGWRPQQDFKFGFFPRRWLAGDLNQISEWKNTCAGPVEHTEIIAKILLIKHGNFWCLCCYHRGHSVSSLMPRYTGSYIHNRETEPVTCEERKACNTEGSINLRIPLWQTQWNPTQWIFSSPVSGVIFIFARPVCGFPGATFTNNICVCLKENTATWQKGTTWWKICQPRDVFFFFFENPVRA